MTSFNKFSNCENAEAVRNELRTALCCDFLNEETCRQNFTRFMLRSRMYLKTPAEQSLSKSIEILDKLEEKGLFGVDNYGILKDIVKDTDVALTYLIEEAEKRISSIRRDTDAPILKKGNLKKDQSFNEDIKGIDVSKLKERLREINRRETEVIPVSPLQEGYKLPIEQLYASVVIREDLRYNSEKRGPAEEREAQENKEVKSPDDIFTIDGDRARRVYMQGDAARGKTTYCLWLLKQWCDAKNTRAAYHNEWEKALNKFDFAFYIPLCHVDSTRVTVADMICKDALHEEPNLHKTVEHVLLNDKYRCLVIIDGLEEWKQDKSVLKKLRCKALPNFDNLSNCVYFITLRPLRFNAVSEFLRNNDRVIELKGFDNDGITKVIENVLVNHYGLTPDSAEYRTKYDIFIGKLKNETLRSFIQIPLLAVVCVQLWYEEKEFGDSITSLYAAMVGMLVERAYKKHQIQFKDEGTSITTRRLPKIFSENENLKKCFSVLLKLGEVAYNGLLSNKDSLVFLEGKIEKDIGRKEFKFARDVGLISHGGALSVIKRNVSIKFFHTSLQEFFAAIFIVVKRKVADSFYEHLSNIKVIMELSNVIMFVCGMSPSLGTDISQHVVKMVDSDDQICKYRKSLGPNKMLGDLYKLQVTWYREIQEGQTDGLVTQTDKPVTFHVSDIYLSKYSDTETVRVTRELMSGNFNDIRSFYLSMVPIDGECGITNTQLNDFLSERSKLRSLVKLSINGFSTERSVYKICGPALKTLSLFIVKIQQPPTDVTSSDCSPLLTDMPRLCRLEVSSVTLGNRELGLNDEMVNLNFVRLQSVNMSTGEWERLSMTLGGFSDEDSDYRKVSVELRNTVVDDRIIQMIRHNRHFSVTSYSMEEHGGYKLYFETIQSTFISERIWPPD